MADAFIYYREALNSTESSGAVGNYPNPNTGTTQRNTLVTNLETTWPAQILRFTLPDELLESVSMSYENNIKDSPTSEPDGTRRINKQDNGLTGITLILKGRFLDKATDISRLIDMGREVQVEASTDVDALGFGKFGFFTDNTEYKPFNLDPDSTKGYTIKNFTINRTGMQPTVFDFSVTMTFGGTYVGVE